jgi:threonine dehydrogenase-like Zn-dependent dehydrogenase
VLDRNAGGVKEALVRELGGTFHVGDVASLEELHPDIVMECTGAPAVIHDVLGMTAPAGIVCLLGVSAAGASFDLDIGLLNRTLVLNNDAVFGAVNANRRHYEMAAAALVRADKNWLAHLITRRVPLTRWSEALEHRPGDIKVVIDFSA